MNREDYIKEGLRQLSDDNHYEELNDDLTLNYNNQIHQILQQAVNLEIIDEKLKKTLYNKTPRIPNFYMLPKIHKIGIPGRPIVNGIGSITEKISAYIDEEIKTPGTQDTKLLKGHYPSYKHPTRKETGTYRYTSDH